MRKCGIIVILLLALVLTATNACGSGDTEVTSQQLVEVVRDNIHVTVTGDGNIEASRETRLTFGSGGKVDKISVKEGDKVSKGDVLARLDTSALELAKSQAQVALTQAKVALTQAKLAQQTAEYNLKNTLDTKSTLEITLFNAQIDVKTAKYNVEQTRDLYTWSDIKIAQANVDDAESYLRDALEKLYKALPVLEKNARDTYPKIEDDYPKSEGYEVWQKAVIQAQARLDTAKANLDAILGGYDIEEVAIKKLQLEAAEKAEAQAQKTLDKLTEDTTIKELEVESAKESAEHARQSVNLAQQSLTQAQKDLDEATIIAPFNGVVASVGAKEGGTVPSPATSPQTVVYLIDPDTLELMVELDEIDIPEVKLDQEAIISIDALPDIQFTGEVTSIYPVPITEGGVVLYNVKINLDVTESSGARVGMSASADIVTNKRDNVLMVPERAIMKDSQGNPYVQVIVDEQTQERPVVLGISNNLQVEILSGLSEGETVIVELRKTGTPNEPSLFF